MNAGRILASVCFVLFLLYPFITRFDVGHIALALVGILNSVVLWVYSRREAT